MMALLGAFAALFAAYGAHTALRSVTRIVVSEDAISATGPRSATVRWRELERMRLDYYSTRRDGAKGWMQMRLGGGGEKLRIDSTIDGFAAIAARAARAAAERELALAPATLANLASLGIASQPGITTGRSRWPTS
jgi:hypothetical protein